MTDLKPHFTTDGRICYPKRGWEPPPCPPGYRSLSSDSNSDEAWILVPLEPICKHLQLVTADVGACGYHRVARRCQLINSFIGQRTCETCLKKEVQDG